MPHSPSAGKEGKRLELPDDGLRFVSKRSFSRFLAMLSSALGVSIKIDGATSSQSRDGELNFKIAPAATAAEPITHQWQPTRLSDTTLSIATGRVNGTTPTGMSSVTVDDEDLQYVHVKQAVTVTTSSSFVTGFTPGALTIDVHTSERTSTDTNRYYLLFTWQAGAVVTQLMRHNIGLMVRDARAGSPGTTEWLDWLAAS